MDLICTHYEQTSYYSSNNAADADFVASNDNGQFSVTYSAKGVFEFLCTATDPDGNQASAPAWVYVEEGRLTSKSIVKY